jgi:hypothetical protein
MGIDMDCAQCVTRIAAFRDGELTDVPGKQRGDRLSRFAHSALDAAVT